VSYTLYVHFKTHDWLKPVAEKLLQRMAKGEFRVLSSLGECSIFSPEEVQVFVW
jgi:hypothetical protein